MLKTKVVQPGRALTISSHGPQWVPTGLGEAPLSTAGVSSGEVWQNLPAEILPHLGRPGTETNRWMPPHHVFWPVRE